MNISRKHTEMKEYISKYIPLLSGIPAGAIGQYIHLSGMLDLWISSGMKTFLLDSNLVNAFKLTDIPMTTTIGNMKFPYPQFIIQSDSPLFSIKIRDLTRDIHDILFIQAPSGYKWTYGIYGLYSLGTGIESMSVRLDSNDRFINALEHTEKGLLPLEYNEVKDLICMFINTVLYINDPDRPRKETEENRTRNTNTGSGYKTTSYIYLKPPSNISIPKNLYQLNKRFLVRGHWRNQPYGTNKSEYKYIWIYPYWKGDSTMDVINNKYKVI